MRARTALPSSIVVVRGNWPGTNLERRLGAQVDDRLHAVPRRVRHRQSAAKSEKESESGKCEVPPKREAEGGGEEGEGGPGARGGGRDCISSLRFLALYIFFAKAATTMHTVVPETDVGQMLTVVLIGMLMQGHLKDTAHSIKVSIQPCPPKRA